MYVIEILGTTKKCWVASWEGDPPRTLDYGNAQTFESIKAAEDRIMEVGATHPDREVTYVLMKVATETTE